MLLKYYKIYESVWNETMAKTKREEMKEWLEWEVYNAIHLIKQR